MCCRRHRSSSTFCRLARGITSSCSTTEQGGTDNSINYVRHFENSGMFRNLRHFLGNSGGFMTMLPLFKFFW
jgi:hypothetical protein